MSFRSACVSHGDPPKSSRSFSVHFFTPFNPSQPHCLGIGSHKSFHHSLNTRAPRAIRACWCLQTALQTSSHLFWGAYDAQHDNPDQARTTCNCRRLHAFAWLASHTNIMPLLAALSNHVAYLCNRALFLHIALHSWMLWWSPEHIHEQTLLLCPQVLSNPLLPLPPRSLLRVMCI